MIKRLLQGRPLGHPLHPILVHLPIGLFFLSFVLDVVGLVSAAPYARPARYAMLLGVATALLASVPGFADYSSIRRDHPGRKCATWHMLLNLAAVAMYAVNLAVRWPRDGGDRVGLLPFAMSLIGVGLLSVSGYLGGVMIYDDGIAVGRHRRRADSPDETIRRDGPPGMLIEIPGAAGLVEGQTLRASVNGVVMTVARVEGKVYAFQEFCTHRYGPLSEGKIEGANIMCPWHRSCFDVRTGKVASGPAKVDLKTYPVREEEGRIWVGISSVV